MYYLLLDSSCLCDISHWLCFKLERDMTFDICLASIYNIGLEPLLFAKSVKKPATRLNFKFTSSYVSFVYRPNESLGTLDLIPVILKCLVWVDSPVKAKKEIESELLGAALGHVARGV